VDKTPWQIYKENKELAERAASEEAAMLLKCGVGTYYDEGVESPAEQRFWDSYLGLRPPQLNGLVTQHKVPPYRIDFAIPGKKIGIEIDGYEYHSDKYSFTQDRQRERDLDLAGWRLIRFSGEEVFRYPDECVLDAARLVSVFRKAKG